MPACTDLLCWRVLPSIESCITKARLFQLPEENSWQTRGLFNLLKPMRLGIECVGTGKPQASSGESKMEI